MVVPCVVGFLGSAKGPGAQKNSDSSSVGHGEDVWLMGAGKEESHT